MTPDQFLYWFNWFIIIVGCSTGLAFITWIAYASISSYLQQVERERDQ